VRNYCWQVVHIHLPRRQQSSVESLNWVHGLVGLTGCALEVLGGWCRITHVLLGGIGLGLGLVSGCMSPVDILRLDVSVLR